MSVYRLSEADYAKRLSGGRNGPKAKTSIPRTGLRVSGVANAQDVPIRASLVIPWPPTGNSNVRHTRTGQHYRTAEYINFRSQVASAVAKYGLRDIPLKGRLRATLFCFPPDRRERDLDNVCKPVLDALQHAGVFVSDGAVDEIRLLRLDVYEGKVWVIIESILKKGVAMP